MNKSLEVEVLFFLFIPSSRYLIQLLLIFLQSADTPMVPHDFLSVNESQAETQSNPPLPAPPALDEECESMESINSSDGDPIPPKPDSSQPCYPVVYPAFYSPFYPVPLPLWPGYTTEETKKEETHEVLKPTAVHSKSPINVDELVGMSKLSLGESIGGGPSSLSLKLLEGSSRQSAFHANPASGSSNINSSSSPIHAV